MTVTNTTNKIKAIGNDVTTAFPFSFKIFNDTDLEVYKVTIASGLETVQTLNVDYTVAINPATEGGTVTYIVAPTSLEESFIRRVLPLTQTTDIPTESNLPEKQLENTYDKNVMLSQQLEEKTSRSIILPISTDLSDLILPAPSARRSIIWNDTEDGLINSVSDPDQAVNDSQANAAAAAASAAAALVSENNSATSETNAATSETNAGISETNAAASAAAALISENNAATSETNAGVSETNAAASAAAALVSENNAGTSETNAATSETNAATSETNAATSETNAGISETNAAASAAAAAAEVGNFENAPVIIKTDDYNILTADSGFVIVLDSPTAKIFNLIPTPIGGEVFMIKNIGVGNLVIKISPAVNDTFGYLSKFESIIIYFDSINNSWKKIVSNTATDGLVKNETGVGIKASSLSDYDSGSRGLELKDKIIFYDNFDERAGLPNNELRAVFSEGNPTGIIDTPNIPSVSGGRLDLRGGGARTVIYEGSSPSKAANQGCIRFTYIPNYVGAEESSMITISNLSDFKNNLKLYHNNSQEIVVHIRDKDAVIILDVSFPWVQSSGTAYEIELNWDTRPASPSMRLFIDGVLIGQDFTGGGIRDSNINLIGIGGSSVNATFDNLIIFDRVQHVRNYVTPSGLGLPFFPSPTGQLQAKVDDATIEINSAGELAIKTFPSGASLQYVETVSSAIVSGSTAIPYDATIPQNTEGVEMLTASITPVSATSKLIIEVDMLWGGSGDQEIYVFALFQDSIVDAVWAFMDRPRYTVLPAANNDSMFNKNFRYSVISGSLTPRTYKIRIGTPGGDTVYMNRSGDFVPFGGIAKSFMRVHEVSV